VFEINRNFRNEGIDIRHNPEFTMMEVYQAYADYRVMMDLTEEIVTVLVDELGLPDEVEFDGRTLRIRPPWPRSRYADLYAQHVGVDIDDREAALKRAQALDIETEGLGHFDIVNKLFETLVEPELVNPTFVIDYPTPLCPLTKENAGNPATAERFELFIANMELANAYTELNDPIEQRKRFEKQAELATTDMGDLDEDFLTSLEHGMPPAGGLGIGIDRLVMVLTGQRSIRDVILFPLLRPIGRGGDDGQQPDAPENEE